MQDTLFLALGELLQKEISAEQLLHRVVDVMAELLDADRGTIFLIDPGTNELVSLVGHLPEVEEIRVPLTQGVAGYVARTQRIVNIPYCEEDSRFWSGVDQLTGYTTRSMLAAPMSSQNGEFLGVLQFLNKRGGIFTAEDEERFSSLAEQAAALLEQTTLGQGPNYLSQESKGESSQELEPPLGDRINRVIGFGSKMREVFRGLRRVASTEATVLLWGESGTGKSLLARAIHHNSPRRDGPLIQIDCTTLPEGLMENELFGHERGAYTGAHERKIGKVEAAEGGTLFLDEIGDLSLQVQGKFLTLLQDQAFYRVGGTERQHANIRIVAATNRPLEQLVQDGRFRQDLYYRLRVVQLELPPLRERGREDLIRLINHFLAEAAKRHNRPVRRLHPRALSMLLEYPWPGNVRELEHCLESAVIFSDGDITPHHLPLPRSGLLPSHLLTPIPLTRDELLQAPSPSPSPFADEPSLRELEAEYIAYLLKQHDGNRSACARILDIGRNTLLRKIKEYDLD